MANAMQPDTQRPHVLRFGVFEVDLEAGQLRKNGRRVRLQEQPFRVLALLLEKPGRVVTREELQEKVWPDTHVDFDHSLNTAINKIREALGDTAANPRFVETLPGRGYKFLAPVEGTGADSQTNLADSFPPKAGPPRTNRHQRLALIALTAAFAITAVVLFFSLRSDEPSRPPPLRRYTIASAGLLPTGSWRPNVVVSPNGRYIAYLAHSEQSDLALWLHDLTVDAAREIARVNLTASPFWSPDSRFLAFNTGSELKKVSIGGGQPITVCKLDHIQEGA